MEKNITTKDTAERATIRLKGKYITVVGRRKSASAQVRVYKNGTGIFLINGSESDYFTAELLNVVKQPLKLTNHSKDLNVSLILNGGGKIGQAEAAKHAIAKALVEYEKELRPSLKVKGWLMRDDRIKERKKPGLKKARKSPQWAKR